ncbi:hypothetical protein N9W89_06500 [Hellea sp.]|nr:hypothetical protein [Hellea sp.]
MRKSLITLIFVQTYLFLALDAVAQSTPENPFGITPDISQSGGFFGSGLQVEASKGSSDIKANIGFDFENPETIEKTVFSLIGSTSLKKNDDRTDFITDNGLPSDYSIGGEISHIFTNFQDNFDADAEIARILKSARDECKVQFPSEKVKCSKLTGGDLLESRFSGLTTSREKQLLTTNPNLVNFTNANFYLVSFSGKIGEETQKYRNSMTFEEIVENKTPYSLSASLGLAPSASAVSYYAGVSHEISYKADDKRILCNSETPIECFNSSFAEPEKKKESTVYGLFRIQKSVSIGRQEFPIGIEAKIAYDFNNKVLGTEVPVYFSINKEGDLIGGVRFRWDDDDDPDISLGVFIGKKFNLFN